MNTVLRSSAPYEVKLEVFEGPFDLLLSLIAKHKLDIYDIPLSQITSEYLDYLRQMRKLDLEVASEFLLVAATLLELKSASLLPRPPRPEAADLSAAEKQALLISRLLEYKKFKNAAAGLESRLRSQAKYYLRVAALEPRFMNLLPDFLAGVEPTNLRDTYEDILRHRRVRLIDAGHIGKIHVSIEDKLKELREVLATRPRYTFKEWTAAAERDEIIAAFLALLELYKQGLVLIEQAVTFGEIEFVRLDA